MPDPIFVLLSAFSLCASAGMGAALLLQRHRQSVSAREAAQRLEAQGRALEFHRQTLRAVTGGRLRFCEPAEVPALMQGERLWSMPLLEPPDVSLFRRHLRALAARRGFSDGRLDDLCSCVSEAAANAVRHSQGGIVQVWASEDSFTVLVSDCGTGLAPDALLDLGEEQAGENLGIGFRLMLALADTLAVCTGAEGTQLVLTVRNQSAAGEGESEWRHKKGAEDGLLERAA